MGVTLKQPAPAGPLQRLALLIARIGIAPGDDEDTRLQKTLLVVSSLMLATGGLLWGATYALLGEPLAAVIPASYGVLSLASVAGFARTCRYRGFRFSQLALSLILPFLLQLALGGFVNSSAVVLWSLTSPLGALVFAGRRQAVGWFMAYLALVAASAVSALWAPQAVRLPPVVIAVFFVMNIGGTSLVAFVLLQYFVGQKDLSHDLLARERRKSENLLLNILPREIAEILKNERRTIAEQYESASILFADAVNFTPMSATMTPTELVELLDEVFSCFDTMVEEHGLEKIKTIGDCYMAAAGVPRPRPDHAHAITRLALAMRACAAGRAFRGRQLSFRIGINSGPVVAGVIGHKKFIYDLWGDAVNTASRMESHGAGGVIQITAATHALIRDAFVCEPRGVIQVKGKGAMPVWHVLGEKMPASAAPGTPSVSGAGVRGAPQSRADPGNP